jgi:hypothetical protein
MSRRTHRWPDQCIVDLEAKMETIKHRAERQKARKSPVLRHVRASIKSIDKAVKEANGDQATRQALGEARATLAACLQLAGVVVPTDGGSRRTRQTAGNGATVTPDDLFAYVEAHPGSRGEQIADAFGTQAAVMRPVMKRLIAAGQATTRGARRGMAYLAGLAGYAPGHWCQALERTLLAVRALNLNLFQFLGSRPAPPLVRLAAIASIGSELADVLVACNRPDSLGTPWKLAVRPTVRSPLSRSPASSSQNSRGFTRPYGASQSFRWSAV